MIRLILFSLVGVVTLYLYYLFKRQLYWYWVLQRVCYTRVKSRTDIKGTLVKDLSQVDIT